MSTPYFILIVTPKRCKLIFMKLADRVKERRISLGYTQGQLAAKINSRQQIIQKIEKGLILNPRNIQVIANALETTPEYLLFGKRHDISYAISIPVVDKNNIGGDEAAYQIKKINLPGNYYSLIIEDDSMVTRRPEPSFPPGTTIIVDPSKTPEIGNLVIVKHKPTGKVLFRKYTDLGITRRLSALNEFYDSFLAQDAEFLGVVVASMNLDL